MTDAYGFGRTPPQVTEQRTVRNLRCESCDKLLAELVTSPYQIRCARCKKVNIRAPDTVGTDK